MRVLITALMGVLWAVLFNVASYSILLEANPVQDYVAMTVGMAIVLAVIIFILDCLYGRSIYPNRYS
jgi:hypothetical protein